MESEFYLQSRREWDERYGDLVLGKRNWQITSAGLMLLSLVLAVGIVWMSARTKVIPFVVEVDKLGYAITIPTALAAMRQQRGSALQMPDFRNCSIRRFTSAGFS